MKKIISSGMLLIVMSFSLLALSGCNEKSSKYTETEHIQRVTERIEERFMTEKFEYTDFEVYPLYNENDELKYFLVEFEPYGFVYVLLRDESPFYISMFGGQKSMYKLSDTQGDRYWNRYNIDETNSQNYPDTDKIWEIDENGEIIVYKKSPYSIENVQDTHRYLLRDSKSISDYVPAVKIGEKYKNLISMEEMTISDGRYTKKQATVYIPFIAKKDFDL